MDEINYNLALIKVKKTIAFWENRSLTPFGKITVIKTLILSKLNHLFTSIPLPQNQLLFNFMWDEKPEKNQ